VTGGSLPQMVDNKFDKGDQHDSGMVFIDIWLDIDICGGCSDMLEATK
jgi:hypothetical protein